jgi:hypothetical protein
MRALTSMPPPAEKGTMSVIGRVGHSWAAAGAARANVAVNAAAAVVILLGMQISLVRRTLARRGDRIKA